MLWSKKVLLNLMLVPGCVLTACASNSPPEDFEASRIWLMGEVHDNPQAHKARYELIASKVKAGWRPALAMEQFDREHQGLLRTAQDECKTAQCITSRPWVEKWQWDLYEPLIQLALDNDLTLLAVNVSRRDANRIVQGGYQAALDPATISQYLLNKPLPELLEAEHRTNIVEGHCNMLPASVVEKMIPAQVARDVWMAKVLAQQAEQSDVILIAGNGHVQKHVGVIQWLPVKLKRITTAHGFIEDQQGGIGSEFDVVHRIPAFPREDPCKNFEAMMK